MILPVLFLVLITSLGAWGRIIIDTVPTNLSIPASYITAITNLRSECRKVAVSQSFKMALAGS